MVGNLVKYYDAATVLTTTPAAAFDTDGANVLEVQNDTASDIIVRFSGLPMLIKANTKKIQNFISSGTVTLETTTGSSSGNFFIQVSRG